MTTVTTAALEVAQTFSALKTFSAGIAGLGFGYAIGNVDSSTNSTSYNTVAEFAAITFTTRGGNVIVAAVLPITATVQDGVLTVSQDGVDGAQLAVISSSATANTNTLVLARYAPSAGSHTYRLRAKTASAGGTIAWNMSSKANGLMFAFEVSQ